MEAALVLAIAGLAWSPRNGSKGFTRFWAGAFVITVFVAEMRIGLARLTESENRYRSFFDQSSLKVL